MTDFTGTNLTREYVRAEGTRQAKAAMRFVFAVVCLVVIPCVAVQMPRVIETLTESPQ